MPDNYLWHDDAHLRANHMKGMTWAYARVMVDAVRDAERRCYTLRITWDVLYRTAIDVGYLAQLRARAIQDVQDMVETRQQAHIPCTPQEISELETELQVHTLVPEATYGHERQHRISMQQSIDAALQPGGPLHQALELAARVCTVKLIADRFALLWRRWFLRRLRDTAQAGAGHDSDPATAKPPNGIGVPLPAGETMPPATSTDAWNSDRQALTDGGYELIAPHLG